MNPISSRQSGFSLLEAIVALTLVATLGASLFSWINNSLASLHRVQQSNVERSVRMNVLEYCKAINPMLKPEGEHDFGTYRLSWKAKEKTPPVDGTGYPAGNGNYKVGLYTLEIRVRHADGSAWFESALTQVGYQRVRNTALSFMQ